MAIKRIDVPLQSLLERAEETSLTAAVTAAATTLTVKNITGITIDQILLIGELGSDESEIVHTHGATAPTGTTITLSTGITRDHSILTRVRLIPYNQVEYSHADTETGAKSVLATETVSGNTEVDSYDDSTETAGFYFWRFKNSIGTTYSDYSDAILYAGKASNSVGYAIDYALRRNDTERSDRITNEFLYEEVNSCLRYITGKRKKWAKLQKFDYVLGQTTRGLDHWTLPTDMYHRDNNRSILDIRVGTDTALAYRDKKEFDSKLSGVYQTDVRTEGAIGAITLEIDNSYDFADSGSVDVFISGTKYTLTYTGVTRSETAGVLTGIPASGTGSITATIAVDTRVWQDEEEGIPAYYTIYDEKLWIYPLSDASNDDMNVLVDYWTEVSTCDSDGDVLDLHRFDLVKDWLTWTIRAVLKNDGKRPLDDPDYLLFQDKLKDFKLWETSAQKYSMTPRLNQITP